MNYEPLQDELLAKLRDPEYDASEGIPHHHAHHDSVRRVVTDDGTVIEIRTHYEIVIDGDEFPDPIHVGHDGSVHYHGFPQYRTASAVELVKRIATEFSKETPPSLDDVDNTKATNHG